MPLFWRFNKGYTTLISQSINIMKRLPLSLSLLLSLPILLFSQTADLTAKEIVQRSDDKLRGESSRAQFRMEIVRPDWSREIRMKAWSLGDEYSLIVVTDPPREEGTGFLKRDNELWNWQPTIDRVIKLPPSMMMQSWMGSDFTNDDLIRESSVVEDYEHELLGEDTIDERNCFKIQMTPKPEASVVWGRVITWIDTADFMQLKAEFYDEDDYLVNTLYGKEVKILGGKLLPSIMEMIPAEEKGHKTVVEYLDLVFDVDVSESFFSIRNMKNIE